MSLLHDMDDAERKAWNSLSRYKFMQCGYWAAIWVHLNRVSGARRPNPFKRLVTLARETVSTEEHEPIWWHVNVGDGDSLTVEARSLREVEEKLGDEWHGLVNAVVRAGHEDLLRDWQPLKEAK